MTKTQIKEIARETRVYIKKWDDIIVIELNELSKYLYKKVNINGLDTYIISPEKYDEFLDDEYLVSKLPLGREWAANYIDKAKKEKKIELYYAIAQNTHVPRPFCFSVLCLQVNNEWSHVVYNEYWMCRDCKHEIGPIVRPLVWAESSCYAGMDKKNIRYPDIFKDPRCEKCGHFLNTRLLNLQKL